MRGFARRRSFEFARRGATGGDHEGACGATLMSPPQCPSGPRMPALTEVSSAPASALFQAPPDLEDGKITAPASHNCSECDN
ncbi:MAG: hypothetical protein O7A68_06905 [Alphaproteobacteria bacterium]|nr:hypothetical protein [Alphaproteobacteria bacterium]